MERKNPASAFTRSPMHWRNVKPRRLLLPWAANGKIFSPLSKCERHLFLCLPIHLRLNFAMCCFKYLSNGSQGDNCAGEWPSIRSICLEWNKQDPAAQWAFVGKPTKEELCVILQQQSIDSSLVFERTNKVVCSSPSKLLTFVILSNIKGFVENTLTSSLA